jgi:Protein of unknown function (DUF2786)
MRSAIIETLRKLIEHEKSANAIGNFAEAEAFAEKFQKLMQAHNLTMADLGLETLDWQEEVEIERPRRFGAHPETPPSWQEVLGSVLGDQRLPSSR